MSDNNIHPVTNLPSNIVSTFDIPDELAKELDELITRNSVLTDLLNNAVESPAKFAKIEGMLMPVRNRYTAIKNLITYEYVPDEYRTDAFAWVYAGYDLVGPVCWIEKN